MILTKEELSEMTWEEKDRVFCALCKGRIKITLGREEYLGIYSKRCMRCNREFVQL